ncbi:MAG: factor-independent urate hydroxylase [Oscillochloridaceae bacterium umkhey_bin13]
MHETHDAPKSEAGGLFVLAEHRYGKAEVRVVKVARGPSQHEIWDLKVAVALEGDFAAAYYSDDNSRLPATDTMRNTIYVLAQRHPLDSLESFGLALGEHFLGIPSVSAATITLSAAPWERIKVDQQPHPHAFLRSAGGQRTARVYAQRNGERQVSAGIDDLLVLKTTESGWADFYRDELTTLADTDDRIFATMITASWDYATGTGLDFTALWHAARDQILTSFCDHYSPSVQHTLYRMGAAVLAALPPITRITLKLPNKHHLAFDLARFGITSQNEIFHATSEPYGLIEGTIERR